MRAIVFSEKGPSSVMRLVERPVPYPEAGQVRVKIIRAAVNPTDWKARANTESPMEFPEITPGRDGAGIIDALGPGVHDLVVDDRVSVYLAQHGLPYGTAAEFTVVPAERVMKLPTSLPDVPATYDLGASIGIPALTAHRALTSGLKTCRLGPGTMDGQVVLVQGGAGAVGNAAIQLGRWSGATIITTVSNDRKAALAIAAGAQHIINYRTQDVAAHTRRIAPEGVDLIVEVAPAQNNAKDVEVTRPGATVAVYANDGGNSLSLDIRRTFRLNLRYQFLILYGLDPDLLAAAREDVTAAVAAGALRAGEAAGLPLQHFPLVRTADAHDAVERGSIGKVLIDIQ